MKKALLIGINYYSVPGNTLNGCINDIKNMSTILTSKFGYDASNVTMLRDDATTLSMMPTRANMLAQLNALIAASANYSEIWIHYSGHGSQVIDRNGDETDGLDEVIVPVDFRKNGFITDDTLRDILSKSRCRTFILLDSCHSGTGCDLEWSFEYTGNGFVRTQNNRTTISNTQIFMISGCKDSQTSADIYDTTDKQYEGAFTDMFLKALKQNNYNVSLSKLYKDAWVLLANNRYSQNPIFSSSSSNPIYTLIPTTTRSDVTKPISTKEVVQNNMKDIILGNIIDNQSVPIVKTLIYSQNNTEQIKNNMKNILTLGYF